MSPKRRVCQCSQGNIRAIMVVLFPAGHGADARAKLIVFSESCWGNFVILVTFGELSQIPKFPQINPKFGNLGIFWKFLGFGKTGKCLGKFWKMFVLVEF